MTLVLSSGQIVALNNTTSTAMYWSMWGCEIAGGVPQYKALAQGGPLATTNAWQNVYQVPTGRMTLISGLALMSYYNGVMAGYVGTGSGGYLAVPVNIPANGWVSWQEDGWHYYDQASRRLS